jgi:hypothetical protein
MRDWREHVRRHLPPVGAPPERENEIVAELALQLEQAYQDALAAGAPEDEALRRAQAQFNDWKGLAREIEHAETPGARWWSGAGQDMRFAARHMRRNPVFAAVAIVTLAFGIGANTAIFTIVDALLLRGLPYRDADRLMAIETRRVQQPEIEPFTSTPTFFDLRERARSFESLMGIQPVWTLVLTGRGDAEQLKGLFVSATMFPMLGVRPVVGRPFTEDEDVAGKPRGVALLSYAFWQRRFGGRMDVAGERMRIDHRDRRIPADGGESIDDGRAHAAVAQGRGALEAGGHAGAGE